MASKPYQGNVKFIGCVRQSDKVLVASLQYNNKLDMNAVKSMLAELQVLEERKSYAFSSGGNVWHIRAEGGVVYVLSTSDSYSASLAVQCHKELQRTFQAKIGQKWETAKENQLDSNCAQLLTKMCAKFDDVSELSKIHKVMEKVEVTKLEMQRTIEQALENTVVLEDVEKNAAQMQQQAGLFRKNANVLRTKMWWKNLKMKLIVGGIATAILLGVIMGICAETGCFDKSDD